MSNSLGSKPKRSPQRIAAIIAGLESGMTRRAAAGAAGIHHTTLYDWIRLDPPLLTALETAEAVAESRYTRIVEQAAPTSWQAAAWWLERRKHQDYARRERVDMTVDLNREAERIAAATGLDPADIIAEAERILSESNA